MNNSITAALAFFLSYLLGSFPTGIIVSRLIFNIDIRKFGSGNMGGTNAFRVLGAKWGALVAITDILKGFAAATLIPTLCPTTLPYFAFCCGLCAVAGHVWSVFAQFKGGKGVATTIGVMLALFPTTCLILLGVFGLCFFFTRTVSLSSVVALGLLPVVLFITRTTGLEQVSLPLVFISFALSLFILYTHRSNMIRLLQGKETKFYGHDPQSLKKKSE